MIKKLYEKEFGKLPATSTLQTATGTSSRDNVAPAPAEKKNDGFAGEKIDDKQSDDLEDNWDDDDAWGDFGEKDNQKSNKLLAAPPSSLGQGAKPAEKDLFSYGAKDDGLQDLDDIPTIGDNLGGGVDGKEDFNKVMSTSKENGGLLASIGLDRKVANGDESLQDDDSQQEEDPHKKSDYFDTSKDRIGKTGGADEGAKAASDDGDFDLGLGSSKKPKDRAAEGESKEKAAAGQPASGFSGNEGVKNMTDEQRKVIENEFASLYEGDKELQKVLASHDVANFSIEEKYQIIEAYMATGSATGIQIEMEEGEDVEDMEEIEIDESNID